MDLSKLAPAPWELWESDSDDPETRGSCSDIGTPVGSVASNVPNCDAEFIILARNDLAVKLRRGWHTVPLLSFLFDDGVMWCVAELHSKYGGHAPCYQKHHDVGLLTKADKWYRENVESREKSP